MYAAQKKIQNKKEQLPRNMSRVLSNKIAGNVECQELTFIPHFSQAGIASINF